MMPTVMNLRTPLPGPSQVAFVSFENANDITADNNGVLRIIDENCHEIARFPDTTAPPPPIPASCSAAYANLNTVPRLSPDSGLRLGNIDTNPDVEIIGVLDDHTTNHGGIIAFNLVGTSLIPKWCSAPLPVGDSIPTASVPTIAQLDKPPSPTAEIIVDNKVFDATGALRYSGFTAGGNNCATFWGSPCPRSRTIAVADVLSASPLPEIITGRGIYRSINPVNWTGPSGSTGLPMVNQSVGVLNSPPVLTPPLGTVSNNSLVLPAIAELDPGSPGPEIAATDTMNTTLWVLSASGATLAFTQIPTPGSSQPKCGGPPMIGDADGIPGPEIGVASCSRYTLFKYVPGNPGTLTQVWSVPIDDPSGEAASTLLKTPIGTFIYGMDQGTVWVLNGANGNMVKCAANTSDTVIEGPVVAGFGPGPVSQARLIVPASDTNWGCGQRGVRIFDTSFTSNTYWPGESFHQTDVLNNLGAVPVAEAPSWQAPARNTYRAQQ